MKPTPITPIAVSIPLEDIQAYAYHLYEQRGRADGHDLEDWLEAEQALRQHRQSQAEHSRQQIEQRQVDHRERRRKARARRTESAEPILLTGTD